MSRKAIILLSCILLYQSFFPQLGLDELLHMPYLWTHFQMHKTQEPEITFLEFLRIHYDGESKHAGKDPQHHQKLPSSKSRHMTLTMQLPATFSIIGPAAHRFLMTIGI